MYAEVLPGLQTRETRKRRGCTAFDENVHVAEQGSDTLSFRETACDGICVSRSGASDARGNRAIGISAIVDFNLTSVITRVFVAHCRQNRHSVLEEPPTPRQANWNTPLKRHKMHKKKKALDLRSLTQN